MGVFPEFKIVNSVLVNAVQSNLARTMNDLIRTHQNAHMGDAPFFVVKKGQIARQGLFQKAKCFSLSCLLRRIPQQGNARQSVHHLGKTAAV